MLIVKATIRRPLTVIWHEHGTLESEGWGRVEIYFYKILLSRFQDNLDTIIAVSSYARTRLISNAAINPNKIQVIRNFADEKIALPKKNGAPPNRTLMQRDLKGKFVVGFAARLSAAKGWETFLKAARIAQQENDAMLFVVAGKGKDQSKIKKFIEVNNLSSNTFLLGDVKDMAYFYSLIDCFVLASTHEACPMVVLESQAAGLPVISSRLESVEELSFRHNILFFDQGDAKDLYHAIKHLMQNEILKRSLAAKSLAGARRNSTASYISKIRRLYYN